MEHLRQILFPQAAPFLQALLQQGNILLLHGQSCRHPVPSEFRKALFHGCHGGKHVIGLDRPAGALDRPLLRPCQYKDRPAAALPDAAGNNARQGFMTVGKKNDKHSVVQQMLLPDLLQGLFDPLFGQAFAAVIEFPQLLGAAQGLGGIFFQKQGECPLGIVQSSRRIETGSDHKSGMISAQDLPFKAVDGQETAESDIGCVRRALQSLADKDPVLVQKRHDVADSGQGTERQKFLQNIISAGGGQFSQEQARQFPGDNCPADLRERVLYLSGLRIVYLGVHHGIRRRKDIFPAAVLFFLKGNLVVVCDDHTDAGLLCSADSFRRSDAVVTGQDQADPVLRGVFRHLRIHPVTVPDPVGEDHIRLCSAGRERMHEDIRGTDSVHIIVSDHADRLPRTDLSAQDADCLVHVRQKQGIVQIGQGPPQKSPRLFNSDHIAVADQTRQHLRDSTGLCNSPEVLFFLINHPLCHICSSVCPPD